MVKTPALRLAPAVQEDAARLVALRIEAMRESLERIGRFDPLRARDRFLAGFAPEHTHHLMLPDGERAGFIVARTQGDHWLLDHLYLRPALQNRGLGAAALAWVFAQADAQALPVRVGALRESASNRFYQRHGFALREEGEFDLYYERPARA